MAARRIVKELQDWEIDPPRGCTGGPKDDNIHIWNVTILCDQHDSPYRGGFFIVEIKFPQDYPFKPFQLRMVTKIFHPQLWQADDYHAFCSSLLGANWSPALTISKVLMTVSAMIHEPFSSYQECRCCGSTIDEADAKANRTQENPTGATGLYFSDRAEYNETAREWTLKYAGGIDIPQQEMPPQPVQSAQNNEDDVQNDDDVCVRLLSEWKLSQYKGVLMDEKGYDDVEDWEYITQQQLIDMHFKEGHARRFIRNTRTYVESQQQQRNDAERNNDRNKPDIGGGTGNVSEVINQKLVTLNGMGYQDRTFNLALLNQHNGDINKAIGSLIQFYNGNQ